MKVTKILALVTLLLPIIANGQGSYKQPPKVVLDGTYSTGTRENQLFVRHF